MKVTAARNLHSLQKAMIEVKKTKGTDILTVTFINSKIQNVIRNQGFINKKLSINEYALHIMTSTNAFLEHCHTLEHFKISAMDKEETGILCVSKSPRMFGLCRLLVAQSVVQTLVYTRSVHYGCRLTEEAL